MKIYKPMLAQSIQAPFSSKEWIFEIKWDGIRAISYIDEELSVRSRNQKELLTNFPELKELNEVAEDTVLDGEIIVVKDGKADFQTLIERNQRISPQDIAYLARRFPATYVVFDILERKGESLIDMPLAERKKLLKLYVREGKYVIQSVFVDEKGESYYEAAIKKGVEGIMAKKKHSPYEQGKRSANWLKIKKVKSCDCVIFGYTEGERSREGTFGALILGLYDAGKPVYVGKVGTGFSFQDLEYLSGLFEDFEQDENTLEGADVQEKITWLRPELVCEVGYQMVTRDGRLRMPRFRGLRADKTADECTIEQIKPSPAT